MVKIELTGDEHDFLIHVMLEQMEAVRKFQDKFKRLGPPTKEDLDNVDKKLWTLYKKIIEAK